MPFFAGRDGSGECFAVGPYRASVGADGALTYGDELFAAPLRIATRLDHGWVFVDAQGIVATSERCTGPLRRLAALVSPPAEYAPPTRGRVIVRQPDGLYATDGTGPFARMTLEVPRRARITAAFFDALHGAVLFDGGSTKYTSDGGVTWRDVPLGSDAALDLRATEEGLQLRTLAGWRPLRDDGTAADALPSPGPALAPPAHTVSCPTSAGCVVRPAPSGAETPVALPRGNSLALLPVERAAQELAARADGQHQHLAHDRPHLEPGTWEFHGRLPSAAAPSASAVAAPRMLLGAGSTLASTPAAGDTSNAFALQWHGLDARGAEVHAGGSYRVESPEYFAPGTARVLVAGPKGLLLARSSGLVWFARGASRGTPVALPRNLGSTWPAGRAVAAAPLVREGAAFVWRVELPESHVVAYLGVALGADGGVLGSAVSAWREPRVAAIGRWADGVYLLTASPNGDDWRGSELTLDGPQRSVPAWPTLASGGPQIPFCTEPAATAPGTLYLSSETLGEQPLQVSLLDDADANARASIGPVELRIAAMHTGPCVTHALGRTRTHALRLHAEAPGAATTVLDDGSSTARVELRAVAPPDAHDRRGHAAEP